MAPFCSGKAKLIRCIKKNNCLKNIFAITSISRTPALRDKIKFLHDFCRAMHSMLTNSIPLLESLQLLLIQCHIPAVKQIYARLHSALNSGLNLHQAMRENSSIFPDFLCNQVEVGETASVLPQQFKRLYAHYQQKILVKKRILSALRYPLCVLAFCICIILGLLYYVMPRITQLTTNLGTAQHASRLTCWLSSASKITQQHIIGIMITLISFCISCYIFFRTHPKIGRRLLGLLLKLPAFSKLHRLHTNALWCYTLSTYLNCGQSISSALQHMSQGRSNHKKTCIRLNQAIQAGSTLANAMHASGMFMQRDIAFCELGEATTSLADVLLQLSQIHHNDLIDTIDRILSYLQPALLLLLSSIVATIVAVIYIPLMQVGSQLG